MSRHTLVVTAGLIAAIGIICSPGRVARWAALPLLALLLTACESVPERQPPPPDPPPVVCTLPAGLTEQRTEPTRPAGDYTQRDVASYTTALHAWGAKGWKRLRAADNYSRACEARHTSTGD